MFEFLRDPQRHREQKGKTKVPANCKLHEFPRGGGREGVGAHVEEEEEEERQQLSDPEFSKCSHTADHTHDTALSETADLKISCCSTASAA